MQQQIMRHEDVVRELNEVKAQLGVAQKEKNRAFEELREVKQRLSKLSAENIRELSHIKESLHGEQDATLKIMKDQLIEIEFLKNKLRRAMQAEENKDKAMEDLAFALKEVAAESTQSKEKLKSTEQQLEAVEEEAANLKKMIKSTEQTYESLLKQHEKENDRLTNIINRLRLEAEESHLAWSDKEIEFVKLIKKIEDEKNVVQEENNKLMRSSLQAEEISERSKGETKKLRDILKQALNEANVAKEAASLARSENSFLKESLEEKNKALIYITQESERLKINEVEANESKVMDEDLDKVDDACRSFRYDNVEHPEEKIIPSYRRVSSDCSNTVVGSRSFKKVDGNIHMDDMETERSSKGKKKALLRRFGDILRRKSTHTPRELPHSSSQGN